MDTDRTNSIGLWTHACDFYQAAKFLTQNDQFQLSNASYYLILHSIELALKAFLRGNCVSLKDLQNKYRHDLIMIYNKAKAMGMENYLKLSERDTDAIHQINDYYQNKEFEYIVTGFKRYPQIELLLSFDNKLLRSIKQFCFDKMHCNEPVQNEN